MQNQNVSQKLETPYGYWTSPITPLMTALPEKSNRTCDIFLDGPTIYWTESRPLEKGRIVLMQYSPNGDLKEVTHPGYNVRSKVHEYGGRSFTVRDGVIYFVNAKDQRLYRQEPNQSPKPLTHEGVRLAEFVQVSEHLIAVAEEQHQGKTFNYLAFINLHTGDISPLESEHDFYSSPTLSPDGNKIAWITWDHPQMPWDHSQLWVADWNGHFLANKASIDATSSQSFFQPRWSPQGSLYYISDKEGWWNFFRWDGQQIEAIYPHEAEFGLPLWRLGMSTWDFTGKGEEIICTYQQGGFGKLALLEPDTRTLTPLPLDYTDYSQLIAGHGFAILLAGSPTCSRRVSFLNLKTHELRAIDKEDTLAIDSSFFSTPQAVEFPTHNNLTAHGFFYPPANPNFKGPVDQLPPLLLITHGGPTGCDYPTFTSRIQYWTSRGFAVLDVNYGGSTGYGRAYRERLKGKWGIVDVQDCENGALYLIREAKVDPKKVMIRGGSAGGYTVLETLASTQTFKAGTVYFGVSDLELLAQDTHKFEAYYLEGLIGPYPQDKETYIARSPLHHAGNIQCPVLFFQGGMDKVVPKNQAEKMVEALKKKGIPTQLILYDDEEHGFKEAENIQDSMQKELDFYLSL